MKFRIVLILFLVFQSGVAQKIIGTVSNKANIPIENANVSVWNSDKKEILLGYNYTDEKGFFSIQTKSGYKNIFITVSCIDFVTVEQALSLIEVSKQINFILKSKEIQLDEVIVKEVKAIRVKNDTTFYDPKKFLNGSELKVEDLIKKLPGMTVNSKSGEIKYKGKAIETVKLENDDLFGSNYSLGTKNISVEMVEQVQAIENYFDNPLLKGIKDSDKVAINLKLKKQKTDYSGNLAISQGASTKLLINDEINVLGIAKTFKSFGITSFTNYGGGTLDINSISQGFNNSEASEKEFYATTLLNEPTISCSLPVNRIGLNNTFAVNFNVIYRLSPKISLKSNLVYFNDALKASENYINEFSFNNNIFSTSKDNFFNKKASTFKSELKLTYNLNKKSLLVSTIGFSKQVGSSELNTLQNKINPFQNELKTNNLFYKIKTNYTLRINDLKAIQYYSEFSKSTIPQTSIISPNNNFITGNFFNNSAQESQFSKQVFSNSLIFLKNKNNLKQSYVLGLFNEDTALNSQLVENNAIVDGFENIFNYKKSNIYFEYFTGFEIYKVKVQPYISSNFVNQLVKNYLTPETRKTDFVNNASLSLSYKPIKKGDLSLSTSIISKTPDEEFLFINKVLENNNSIKRNVPTLDIVKSINIALGYKYYDLMKQIGFDFTSQYTLKQNTFLSNYSINPNFTTATFFQSSTNIETKNIAINFEKQINFLKLYLKQSSSYIINNYKNAIDNFALRDNKSKNLNLTLLLFSNFDFLINFDNRFNYNLVDFVSNDQFINRRISFNNTFKIAIKPAGNISYSITQDYFVPNYKSYTNFNFVDIDIKYKSMKYNWLAINFTAKNLLNIKTFTETNNSDFSSTIYSTNLLPRYFLISTNFSF